MLLDRKQIYTGKIVDLIVDTIELKGQRYIREVVRHPGGVVIIAELPDGRIPFVRQSRYPIDKKLLELPAGKLDPGEEPLASAARELEEETGFKPESLEHVFTLYTSPGFCDELLHLYYTNKLTRTQTAFEHDEEIDVEFYSLDEALQLAHKGQINDAKTLIALFWLAWTQKNL